MCIEWPYKDGYTLIPIMVSLIIRLMLSFEIKLSIKQPLSSRYVILRAHFSNIYNKQNNKKELLLNMLNIKKNAIRL